MYRSLSKYARILLVFPFWLLVCVLASRKSETRKTTRQDAVLKIMRDLRGAGIRECTLSQIHITLRTDYGCEPIQEDKAICDGLAKSGLLRLVKSHVRLTETVYTLTKGARGPRRNEPKLVTKFTTEFAPHIAGHFLFQYLLNKHRQI